MSGFDRKCKLITNCGFIFSFLNVMFVQSFKPKGQNHYMDSRQLHIMGSYSCSFISAVKPNVSRHISFVRPRSFMRSPGIWSLLYECWDGFESTYGSDINQYKLGIFVSGHELTEYETFVSTKRGDTEWGILSTVILAPNRCLSQLRHRSSSKESLI